MILAVQKLREMSSGGALLARWTIGYYVATTVLAILHSVIAVAVGWRRLMTVMPPDQLEVSESDQEMIEERQEIQIHKVVEDMFKSLIPENIINSLASNDLLAVLVTSVIVGYLIKGPNSSVLRATVEIEKIIMIVITFLIKCAPIGVFFLILPNFFKLDVSSVGQNLGVLIAATLSGIFLHLCSGESLGLLVQERTCLDYCLGFRLVCGYSSCDHEMRSGPRHPDHDPEVRSSPRLLD
jgi:Na+/H+-dicarboxylate symporter